MSRRLLLQDHQVSDALARVAANHHWTWRRSAVALLSALPTAGPRVHPVAAVKALGSDDLSRLSDDRAFVAGLAAEVAVLDDLGAPPPPEVVYLSPEFALSELIPQYSGGLGVLAGDHLKAASDLDVPLAGIGLFYHHGFFRQSVTGGRQVELYERHDPLEFGCEDTGVVVEVPMASRSVLARVWRLMVGRSTLLLLDTDVSKNHPEDVAICDRLYGADRELRLRQELLLGVGGMRAVAALGWSPRVVHLNEGHAGFALLELIDAVMSPDLTLTEAARTASERIVFTTHTPVPAGIEVFDRHVVEPHLAVWARSWGVSVDAVLELGRDPSAGLDEFNMTAMCLRHCRAANGVSELHGAVSRSLFAGVEGGDRIGFVTNGVHARTWTDHALGGLFDEVLGSSWSDGDPAAWARSDRISDSQISTARRAARAGLEAIVGERTGHALDPDALIIGFARRFAPYKRATLLLRDRDRLLALLHDPDRPAHLVFSGKAHPADTQGKALLEEVVGFSRSAGGKGRLIFVPGYDMAVGRAIVAASDLWLNTPVRPREASGTSGEKVVLNGGLNCSVLDGWWAEMYDGRNGFEIASSPAADPQRRDAEDATSAFGALEDAVAEYFGDRRAFNERIRYAWMTLGPRVTAARMVREYLDTIYGTELTRL